MNKKGTNYWVSIDRLMRLLPNISLDTMPVCSFLSQPPKKLNISRFSTALQSSQVFMQKPAFRMLDEKMNHLQEYSNFLSVSEQLRECNFVFYLLQIFT